MNIKDAAKDYDKYEFYKSYIRITRDNFRYESITKTKMINGIIDYYSDYNNIIDICTLKELNYLEKIIEDEEDLLDDKYYFERTNLSQKLLIYEFEDGVSIIEEMYDSVIEALGNVDYAKIKERDRINEFLVGSLKAFGYDYLDEFESCIESSNFMDKKNLYKIINEDKMFNFYVRILKDRNGEKILIPYDYLNYLMEINAKKGEYSNNVAISLNIGRFRYLFYDVFDRNDDRVLKVLDKIRDTYSEQYEEVLDMIRENLILCDKDNIISSLDNNYFSKSYLKLLSDVIDDIPMPVLNGYSFNQYNGKGKVKSNIRVKHEKQVNAFLNIRDRNEFMKCYTALLEFTNKKFRIKSNLKLFMNDFSTDVAEDVAVKFWENKESIIREFCQENAFDFSEEELSKVREFSSGFNNKFILYKYDKDYAEFILDNKIYMVKGVDTNIDNIISVKDLPCFVNTNIVQFNAKIVCDCFFMEGSVRGSLEEMLDNVKSMKKYYRLDTK